jgi:O-antigen ligase/polysaccharide polymerase Wzy-like membrane protein
MLRSSALKSVATEWPLLTMLLLGPPLIAFLIVIYGPWTLPVVAVAAVGALALYRLDWAMYAVILLLPFTAIEGDYNAYQEVIQSFKRVAVAALAGAWLIHVAIRARTPRFPRWLILPFLVLAAATGLSVLRAPEPGIALTSTARLLTYLLVYVVIVADVLRRPEDVWRAVRMLLLAAVVTSAFAFYQLVAYFSGWPTFMNPFYETQYVLPRVHSFMREPLWLSNYLLTVLPIALALFCWRAPRWTGLAAVTIAASGLGLLLATSRLGWASALVMGFLFIVVAHRFVRLPRFGWVVGALLLSLVAASSFWLREFGSIREMSKYVADFATFASPEHGEGDLEAHVRLVGLVPQALRTSPLIGIGTNNVGFKFYHDMNLERPRLSTTHNTYLDAMMETGGLGLAAFLSIVIGALVAAWRGFKSAGARSEGALFLGIWLGIVGMAFHLTNWSGWREAHVWFALGLAYACHSAFQRSRPEDSLAGRPRTKAAWPIRDPNRHSSRE